MVTKGRMGLSSPFAVIVSVTVWMRTKAAKAGGTVPKFLFRRLWAKLREDSTERTKWRSRNLSRDKASNSKTWINEAPESISPQTPYCSLAGGESELCHPKDGFRRRRSLSGGLFCGLHYILASHAHYRGVLQHLLKQKRLQISDL